MKHRAGLYAKYNDRGETVDYIEYEASTVFICLPPTHIHMLTFAHTDTIYRFTCMLKHTLNRAGKKHAHSFKQQRSKCTVCESMQEGLLLLSSVAHTQSNTHTDTSTGQRVPVA